MGEDIRQSENVEDARRRARDYASTRDPQRRVTINDIARIADVSKKTISRIINDSPNVRNETREAVRAIMAELDYQPDPAARGLNYGHAFLIGLIYDNPNPQYVVTSQEGILRALADTEFELLVHPCDRNAPDFLADIRKFVERQKLYGVVLTPSVSEDERVADLLRDMGCRHVRIASVELGPPETMLVTNDALGAREAAVHLVELGHTRIAYLTGRSGFRSSEERKRGFAEGLAEAGLSLAPELVIEGDYTFDSGLRAAEVALAMINPPTAIFCANDAMAVGFIQGLRKVGKRVPDEMSVVGYDDFQIARTSWPNLTTIHTPTHQFAQLAASRLLNITPSPALLDVKAPWLVVRDSTGIATG